MAKETQEELFSLWAGRIAERESFMRSRYANLSKYYDYYRNDVPEHESDSVRVNYIFGLTRSILPAVYYKNPEVVCQPVRDTPRMYARMNELLLNYQFEELDFEEEARMCVWNALYAGSGPIKFGFAPRLLQKKRARQNVVQSLIDDSFETLYERGSAFDYDESLLRKDGETHEKVNMIQPFVLGLSPMFFMVDEIATNLETARWVGHVVFRPWDEVKDGKRYPKVLTAQIEPTHYWSSTVGKSGAAVDDEPTHREVFGHPKDSEPLVALYEIWDRERDKLYVIDGYRMRKGEKKFLRVENNPYSDIDGFPFEVLVFNPDPYSATGVSDVETWYNVTEALNLLDSYHFNHVKRFSRKYMVREDLLSLNPGMIDQLQSGEDGAIIRVPGSLAGAVEAVQDAPLSPDAYALRQVLLDRLGMLSGINEPRRGASDKAKTATEASIMEAQSRLRESDRLYLVSKFVEKCARKLRQLDRMFLSPEYVSGVLGEEFDHFWRQASQVEGDFIKAEIDIKVRVGSSAYYSREVRTKQLLDFINLVGPMQDPATGAPILNFVEAVQRIAESLDMEEAEKLINPMVLAQFRQQQQPPLQLVQGQGGDQRRTLAQQSTTLRSGAPNLGQELSAVQNLGLPRGPNPTNPDNTGV